MRAYRIPLLTLLLALAVVPSVWAQAGKIAGTVVDAASGEPLPGVNVIIDGTTQGTATNIDGEYVIIGVRPGSYDIVASFVGFQRVRREGVRVSTDLTTTVDFQLREEVLEGEEVVVVAEMSSVRKDVTSSESRVTSETIDTLPVQEVGDILQAQAGITTSGSGLHIRGGRSSEVAYFIDGVRVSDAYDGGVSVQVENDGIEELQIISGTFNAEYGQAMSGIINVVTKEGGRDFEGSVEAFTGSYLTEQGDVGAAFLRGSEVNEFRGADGILYQGAEPYGYLDVDPAQYYNLQASLSGPIIGDRFTFYAFGRYFQNDGWLYGSNNFNSDGTLGDSSLVPMNSFEKFSGQVNLKYRIGGGLSLSLVALGSTSEGQSYDHGWRWAPLGRPTNYDDGYNLNLKLTHTLSATTFYTVNVSNYFKSFERYLYEDPLDSRYNGFLIDPPDSVVTGGGRFLRGGTDLGHFDRTSVTYLLKGDITSQVARHHLVKGGFEARIDYLDAEGFGLQQRLGPNGAPVEPFAPALPEETSSGFSRFDAEPFTVSAYVQDKIEYDNFIVNAGLRFDYFDARSRVPADPEDPNIFNPFKLENRFRDVDGSGAIEPDEQTEANALTVADREAYWWEDAEPKVQVSPRLGIAYPITAEGVIHFSYGHFLQIPTFNRLFDNSEYKVTSSDGLYGPFGNPNLDAERTVMYELGFKQGFGSFLVDLTAFYRDVRDWVSTSPLIATRLPGVSYVVYTNRDYSNVRGVTLKLGKSFGGLFSFDFNYTFQVAEGSNSNPEEEFFALQNNASPTIALLPLNWDQRHTASLSAFVGQGPWGASTLIQYGSGYPYTPSFSQGGRRGQDLAPAFPTNSRLKPSSFNVNLYLYRNLEIGRFTPRVFLQVYNLLDAGNPNSVFADTGEPDATLEQLQVAASDPGWYVRPDFYAEPRRLQLGLDVRF